MVEIALLQRLSVFLGHPTYALSVVLFSLIFWTGFGSMGIRARASCWSRQARSLERGICAGYLFALPFWLPPFLVDLDGADLFVRAGFCVLVLAPAGVLMGFGFPTGMRLVSAISSGPTPWFWGINGAAGVLAASVAVVTSIAFSIDMTLRIGRSQVHKAGRDCDIGDVGYPQLVRAIQFHVLREIGEDRIIVIAIRRRDKAPPLLWIQRMLAHEPADLLGVHDNATMT